MLHGNLVFVCRAHEVYPAFIRRIGHIDRVADIDTAVDGTAVGRMDQIGLDDPAALDAEVQRAAELLDVGVIVGVPLVFIPCVIVDGILVVVIVMIKQSK